MRETNNLIYFDNAASTPLFPEIIEQYGRLLKCYFANPSASHQIGLNTRKKINTASQELLELVGTSDEVSKIIWTSGGTESNNLVLFGLNSFYLPHSDYAMVSTSVEHSSVFNPLVKLSKYKNNVTWVNVDHFGLIDLNHLSTSLTRETKLVSICLVQSETGAVQDLLSIRKIMDLNSPEALLHIDAVQAFGKVDIPWESAKIDIMSLAGHKIHGPNGVGALVIRKKGVNLTPIFEGGGQQDNLRSGSIDVPGILMFCLAAKKLLSTKDGLAEKISLINRKARDRFNKLSGKNGKKLYVQFNSMDAGSPFILNVSLQGYEGAIIMRMLGERNIFIGTGSACSAESKSPSRILTSMGLSSKSAFEAIRLSFGFQNTVDEIDIFFNELQCVIDGF